ncbi:succinate dehydrogenase, hydrophobic membrane anchor protein [Elioraea rosea]|uniref:succinate dehydrogenase, hydrophobic membrane anchor protein n=1 Tax=Elioraea rosea TaxID=2492390 RepID=UPI0011844518|nr:succinate dehydrogenase, hydrophobic membrane anchor protein [Elioraea rosea]
MAGTQKLTRTTLRSGLGRVRGLGSAKEGVQHWWAQRVTAIALVPLTLWFVASVILLAGADHATVSAWIARPLNTVLLIALVAATFWHAALGLQVVIEDYIHTEGTKLVVLLAVKALLALVGLAGIVAVLRVAL